MEIIPEGRHFRLLQDSELPDLLTYLEQYLPEALKVCTNTSGLVHFAEISFLTLHVSNKCNFVHFTIHISEVSAK